jgi:hypothetical protein
MDKGCRFIGASIYECGYAPLSFADGLGDAARYSYATLHEYDSYNRE